MVAATLRDYHREQAARARLIYVQGLTSAQASTDWRNAQQAARRQVVAALRATRCLHDIPAGLIESGQHLMTLRHLMAPSNGHVPGRDRGWAQQSSGLISNLTDVKPQHFLHKARFATKTRPQEVDIACGLPGTVVLAMECKVTNDETNSVKRINDVLKKATAWQDHWGSFVRTAALLQGVIAFKDVERLLEGKVEVFWSHDLPTFESWLSRQGC